MTEEGQGRERWSSHVAFIFAAVGSAVGLGNIWRFPAIAFQYNKDGGAFLIPYFLALFFVGIPVLLLELALGQTYQSGDAIVFGKMNPRLRGIGVSSVYCGFTVIVYYCALLGWALRCFGYAFQDPLPWNELSNSWGWVTENVIGMGPDLFEADNALAPTKMVWENFLCLVVVWLLVFLSLAFGVKWTGRITYVTMGLPVVLLVVLVNKALMLEGSNDGITAYMGKWDLMKLSEEHSQWSDAVSQIFFSLSVTFGVMTAYGSYNKRSENIVQSSVIIALANSMFSIIAGYAVFGTVGHLAHVQNVTVGELNFGGPGLMFGTYPVALNTGGGGADWNRLLFLVIFILGIDSAFSLCEAVLTVLKDTVTFAKTPRYVCVGVICTVALLLGLPFATDASLILLDVVDYYINSVMLLVGFFETFAAGWLFRAAEQAQRVGTPAVVLLMVGLHVSVLAGSVPGLAIGGSTGSLLGLLIGFILAALSLTMSCMMAANFKGEGKNAVIDLLFGNIEELRDEMNKKVAAEGQWRVPFIWSFLIKFFIPPVLLLLIGVSFSAQILNEDGEWVSKFGNYENYAWGYQFIGMFGFWFSLVIVLAGMLFPRLFAFLAPLDQGEEELSKVDENRKGQKGEAQAVVLPAAKGESVVPGAIAEEAPVTEGVTTEGVTMEGATAQAMPDSAVTV